MEDRKKRPDLRDLMPETARWVAQQRARWGDAWVSEQIKLGMHGQPGHFYALEAGHVIGTPLSVLADWQEFAVITGSPFAGFMAVPQGEAHGAH